VLLLAPISINPCQHLSPAPISKTKENITMVYRTANVKIQGLSYSTQGFDCHTRLS
jgi:hypothetical protein